MRKLFPFILIASIVFLSGCVTPVEPTTGSPTPVYEGVSVRQGTVYRAGDLAIGVFSVRSDSASLSVLIGSTETKVELKVGEATLVDGYSIKNTGTYVDPFPGLAPGSDASTVTLLVNDTRQP